MKEPSDDQVRIDRQFIELGKALREDDRDEVMRHVFNLGAEALGNLARVATALERIADRMERTKN